MSKRIFALIVWALALVSSVFGQYQFESPWPRYQANNSGSGQGIGSGSVGALLWKTSVADEFSESTYGSSVVIDSSGIIYAASQKGKVYAFNSDGGLLWTTATGDEFFESPTLGSDGTLYVASYKGGIYALTSGSLGGRVLWHNTISDSFRGGFAIASDGNLYVAGTESGIYSIDPSTGIKQWGVKPVNQSYNGTPSIGSDGTLYVAGGSTVGQETSGSVIAINPTDGVTLWQKAFDDYFSQCPSIGSDGTLYLESNILNTVYAIKGGASGGKLLWSTPLASGDGMFGAPAVGSDGTIYTADDSGNVHALSDGALGGSILWTSHLLGDAFYGSVSLGSDGTVYVGGTSGIVYALTPGLDSVSLDWEASSVHDAFQCAPAIGGDGTLYMLGGNGSVCAYTFELIRSLTLSYPAAIGGIGVTGTVDVLYSTSASGYVVKLSSNSPYVTVPSSVTVQPGSTSATFAVSTTQPLTAVNCTITATGAHTRQSATLQLLPDYILGLTVSPTSVGGGDTSIGAVTIYQPAPVGGYVVNLSTEYPSAVGVPASVTVPAGSTTATFTITTGKFSNIFNCDIYASDGFSGAQATLNVVGNSIANLTLNPSSIGCNETSTAMVTLSSPAPSTGWVVNISDEYPSSVSVPTTVTIPAGATSATFIISSNQYSNTFGCDIYVNDGFSAKQATLTVTGDSIASFSINPTSVVGGTSCTGTVTLTSNAPPGGWIVSLSTEYSTKATVLPTVTVPAGSNSANFSIATTATDTTYGCGVYASDGHSAKQTTLTITPS